MEKKWEKKMVECKKSVNVMELEWDSLIMLDACRYDTFKNNYPEFIRGNLKKIISPACETSMWVKECINHIYDDVVLVSSQPFLSKVKLDEFIGFNPFFHVEPVWDYCWDDEIGTVPPWDVAEAVYEMRKLYPNKRIMIWFLQPHFPCIGKYPLKSWDKVNRFGSSNMFKVFDNSIVGLDYARMAYVENLRLVLKVVKKLLRILPENVIVSSDHGECFGEQGVFSHAQKYCSNEYLHTVPLLEVKK